MRHLTVSMPNLFTGFPVTLALGFACYNLVLKCLGVFFKAASTGSYSSSWLLLLFLLPVITITIRSSRVLIITRKHLITLPFLLPFWVNIRKKNDYDGYLSGNLMGKFGNSHASFFLVRQGKIVDYFSAFNYWNLTNLSYASDLRSLGRTELRTLSLLALSLGFPIKPR